MVEIFVFCAAEFNSGALIINIWIDQTSVRFLYTTAAATVTTPIIVVPMKEVFGLHFKAANDVMMLTTTGRTETRHHIIDI